MEADRVVVLNSPETLCSSTNAFLTLQVVARATDDHTLFGGPGTVVTVNPHLYKKLVFSDGAAEDHAQRAGDLRVQRTRWPR